MTATLTQRLHFLRNLSSLRKHRETYNQFVINGPTLIDNAASSGIEIEELFYDRAPTQQQQQQQHDDLTRRFPSASIWPVDAKQLDQFADTRNVRQMIAIGRRPAMQWSAQLGGPWLVMCGVSDPGNAGLLIRSAEANGFSCVLCNHSVDPLSPKVVRGSAGSVFRVPIVVVSSFESARQRLAETHRFVGTLPRNATPLEAFQPPPTRNIALVLGNEAHGLPSDIERQMDESISIEMASSKIESLNVAIAGSIAMYSICRKLK
jgi:TrmH family RNA methyltransferase